MKSSFIQLLAIFGGGLLSPAATQAQLVLDGSLGQTETLMGPEYQIGAELGQQRGGNLFHSFQNFNLQSHETATFSGPDTVHNIISRVTGGTPSNIDGLIRSTIPNADFYFLNPYGILFGPHAKLDLQGGFHASTADYLKLQDGGRFETRNLNNSLLSVAPVAAFGFLSDTPTPISVQDSHLNVPKGQTFSLISGGLEFHGTEQLLYDESGYSVASSPIKLSAESGRFNMVSVASPGEAMPTATGFDLTITKNGHLTATNTHLTTYGDAGGQIWIRAGQVMMTNSLVENGTVNQAGGDVDMQVDNLIFDEGAGIYNLIQGIGSGGNIHLRVTDQLIQRGTDNNGNGSGIYTDSDNNGNASQAGKSGNITIQARSVSVTDNGVIAANTYSSGDAGNINIRADEISLTNGSYIGSATYGLGQGGTITLDISKTLLISGTNTDEYYSGVYATSEDEKLEKAGNAGNIHINAHDIILEGNGYISANTWGSGDAGNINIRADEISLTNGSQISSGTVSLGRGGTVTLDVSKTLLISGEDAEEYHSGVFASSHDYELEKAGDAGSAYINAHDIIVKDGGVIRGTTSGTGHGGSIYIKSDTLTVAGRGHSGIPSMVSSSALNNADVWAGGTILKEEFQPGNAGSLSIQAATINILDGAEISTRTNRSGGGDIEVISSKLLYLNHGQLTTSVKGGIGNGGNLTLNHPQFIVLNQGQVKAQADAGRGGNIRIVADHLLTTPDSLISASSRLGIDGQIDIISPDITVINGLLGLSNQLRTVNLTFKNSCGVKTWEKFFNLSTFFAHSIAGRSWSPFDLQPSFTKYQPR